jgi:uncharacterized protein YgbK (DUF1537 family)
MPMARFSVLGLADDLTGALEIGARFSAEGIPSAVAVQVCPEPPEDASALVIDTETRHRGTAEAVGAVHRAIASTRHPDLRLIYKKTDSTLRGNIGAELGAIRRTFPDLPLVYVAAYPRMGRTVKEGRLLVDGVPVHETAFAVDALNPIRESHIPTVLAAQHDGPVYVISEGPIESAQGPGIYLCDAATDDEIEHLAAVLAGRPGVVLAAGPAAFAGALASRIGFPRIPPPRYPKLRRCLIVNGSRHPRAEEQVEHARKTLSGGWTIFDTQDLRETGLARAARTGRRIRALLDSKPLDALIVFGGDTAFGILQALGSPVARPYGEIVPGVPLSKIAWDSRDLYLITKAGGFGPVEILSDIRGLSGVLPCASGGHP